MLPLQNKRILFFAPRFFGYEMEIKNKMVQLGAYVDYFDERPGNSTFSKAALRLNLKGIENVTSKYYRKVLTAIKKNHYDFVFIVNAEAITSVIIEELKHLFSTARFVLYMWDSITNKKNLLNIYQYFDICFSFDRSDALKNSNIIFHPLFYIDDYKPKITKPKYDLFFAGTAHADRFRIVKHLEKFCNQKGLNFYTYLYLHTKLLFLYQGYNDRYFRRNAKLGDFKFKQLTKDNLIDLSHNSKAILDIQHPSQNGLTMRTFEVMGLEKKLVTTNSDIQNYDFYNPRNIYIIDRENPRLEKEFFILPYEKTDETIKRKYSITSWILRILTD